MTDRTEPEPSVEGSIPVGHFGFDSTPIRLFQMETETFIHYLLTLPELNEGIMCNRASQRTLLLLTDVCLFIMPSVLWHCWLGGRKGIRPVKNWVVRCWRGCLERGADLHMPSWYHCHSLSLASVKSRLVLPFWYRPTRVVLEKGPLNGCVCVLNPSPVTIEPNRTRTLKTDQTEREPSVVGSVPVSTNYTAW